jgi:hypothetical protein
MTEDRIPAPIILLVLVPLDFGPASLPGQNVEKDSSHLPCAMALSPENAACQVWFRALCSGQTGGVNEFNTTILILRGGFEAADTNKNGVLDEKEFKAYVKDACSRSLLMNLEEEDFHNAFVAFAGEDKVVDKAEWNDFLDQLGERLADSQIGKDLQNDCCFTCCAKMTVYAIQLACCFGVCTLGLCCLPLMIGTKCMVSATSRVIVNEFRIVIEERKKNGPPHKDVTTTKPEQGPDKVRSLIAPSPVCESSWSSETPAS